ncbi:MAG: 4'-phosphopantetheinyl transferase superfamily protein [Muribaculaceae bacterium]|nr:4'-phosphopantetheinyl transferase superfamily protein [Muribaculaceae bacterium]
MIETRSFGDITLMITRVERLEGDSRADAEHRAVRRLVDHAFGQHAQIDHHPSGAPYIIGSPISISISHSRTHAAIAFSASHTVGVDIEEQRQQLARVAPRVLSEAELRDYSTPDLLLQAWTLKEALYKAALTPALDFRKDISLPLPPAASAATVAGCPCKVVTILTTPAYTLSLVASMQSEN